MRTDEAISSARILIVEDNLINIKILQKNLAGNYLLETATGGEEALEKVATFNPDLILLDVMMPDMDGYEVCRRLRERPATRDTPVLVLTALRQVEALEQAFAAGATDYLTKPFNMRELRVRVDNALLLKQTMDRLRESRAQIERDIEVAGKLQQTLLSTFPVHTGHFDIYPAYRPCSEVAGDVFDVILLPEGRICTYIGDVSGHGVASAMVSTMVKTFVSEFLLNAPRTPPYQLCERLENRFRDVVTQPGMYMTFLLLIYEPESNSWQGFNCGHPPPLVLCGNELLDDPQLRERGVMPIGVNSSFGASFERADEFSLAACPGQGILLYTDGLSEARHVATGEQCGESGLLRRYRDLNGVSAGFMLARRLLAALENDGFQLDMDDSTAVAIQTTDRGRLRLERELEVTYPDAEQLGRDAGEQARACGWDDEAAFGVELLVTEYATNCVRHGSSSQRDVQLTFALRVYDEYALLSFQDDGPAWDWLRSLERSRQTAPTATHGRGLHIIEAIAEHAMCTRRNGRNCAVMQVMNAWRVPRDHAPSEP